MRAARLTATAAALVLVAAALTGCAQINGFLHDSFPDQFGPLRGDDGRVATAIEAHSYYLETGDCFDFPDPEVRTEVRLVPCADEHEFEVIGQGTITLQEEKTQGLQVAASAKCAEPFEEFRANAPAGSRPDQEFLISEQKSGDRTVTEYVCAAALTKL